MNFSNSDPKHVAREKQKGRELRQSQWWKQQIAKGLCHYCEKKVASLELTMDHKIPLSKGGKSSKGNVVPACKECNNAKKNKTPVEMILDGEME